MAVSQFGAPIPGNSLFTHAPGERPWERPAALNTVEEATKFYITSLAREEVMDDMMAALVAGVAINPIAEALTLSQVMKGTHTLDVALLVIMEFLAAVADNNEIDYKFTNKDPQKEIDQKERDRIQLVLLSALSQAQEQGTEDAGTELLGEISDFLAQDVGREGAVEAAQDMPPPEAEELEQITEPEELIEEEQEQAPQDMGLMARR
jgi:hypothetical protein